MIIVISLTGLRADLTEAEVFDNPSRTARLVLAFFHIAQQGKDEIM